MTQETARTVTAKLIGGIMAKEIENSNNVFCPYCAEPLGVQDDGKFPPHYQDRVRIGVDRVEKFIRGICPGSLTMLPAAEAAERYAYIDRTDVINKRLADAVEKLVANTVSSPAKTEDTQLGKPR